MEQILTAESVLEASASSGHDCILIKRDGVLRLYLAYIIAIVQALNLHRLKPGINLYAFCGLKLKYLNDCLFPNEFILLLRSY